MDWLTTGSSGDQSFVPKYQDFFQKLGNPPTDGGGTAPEPPGGDLGRFLRFGGAIEPGDFSYRDFPNVALAGYAALASRRLELLDLSDMAQDVLQTAARNAELFGAAISQRETVKSEKGDFGEVSVSFACFTYKPYASDRLTKLAIAGQAGRRLPGPCAE